MRLLPRLACFLPFICEALVVDDWKQTVALGTRRWMCLDPSRTFASTRTTPLSARARPFSLHSLWAERRASKSTSHKKSAKKTSASPKTRRNDPTLSTGSPGDIKQSPTSRKKTTSPPPWQVMSEKDAKKNVEKELERRRMIHQGLKPSHEASSDTTGSVLSSNFLSSAEQRLLKWKPFQPSSVSLQMRWVGAYLDKKLPPRLGVPEIAFLGRSNVGKSSLLNRLSKLVGSASALQARVGKTPGATASVNLYALQDARHQGGRDVLAFADLPGFGYAKLSKQVQESVQVTAEQYLSKRKELVLGILLLDVRRAPSDDDRAVMAALYDMGVPLLAVATKLDKVPSSGERERCLAEIRDGLGLPENQPLAVSCVTGEGCRTLWKILLEACETGVKELGAKYQDPTSVMRQGIFGTAESTSGGDAMTSTMVLDDDDDVVYFRGYDWIHDTEVGGMIFEEEDEEEITFQIEDDSVQPQRETLRSLKSRARDMIRKGTV